MAIRRYYRQVMERTNLQGGRFVMCDDFFKEVEPRNGVRIQGIDGLVPTGEPCFNCKPEITAPAPGGRTPYHGLPPFTVHSPTSELASYLIADKALTLREKVHTYTKQCGDHGATDHEISAALRLQSDTARPRRRELVEMGHVIDSGRTRETPSHRQAVVWIAVQ